MTFLSLQQLDDIDSIEQERISYGDELNEFLCSRLQLNHNPEHTRETTESTTDGVVTDVVQLQMLLL